MDRPLDLIRLLADGQFHSGEDVANRLGITRAAVWKALRKTTEHYGLTLESVRGRGYRLSQPLELLERERLLAEVPADLRASIAACEVHDEIDSTNARLMQAAAAGAPSGTLCLAERQTAGRGRRGRVWVSPFGVNLYLSLLWRYPLAPAALGGVSLAAGAMVAQALQELGASGIALKWPNDILWQRRKLAGLLVEVAGESQGPTHLVLGIGVNLGMPREPAAGIDQPWADLGQSVMGGSVGRNRMAGRVISALVRALEIYGREGLTPFLDRWERFDAYRGEPVRILFGEHAIEGVQLGIAGDGALRVETAQGVQHFHAGEVSLRAGGNAAG